MKSDRLTKRTSPKDVAVLFSGGLDSTAAALTYLKSGRRVFLLTCETGTQKWISLAERKAAEIVRMYPDMCSWCLRDCTHAFRQIAIVHLEGDVRQFGNLICCGCKLAMLCEGIVFCKNRGISELGDGFKETQSYYPEQTSEYMRLTETFARRFGIKYSHPLFSKITIAPEDLALSVGVSTSGMQPFCVFERNRVETRDFIAPYTREKLRYATQYIGERLKEKEYGPTQLPVQKIS